MSFIRHAAVVAWKDLRVELRTREIVSTTVFFAAVVVVVGSFAFVDKVPSIADLSSGVMWTAITFSGTIGLGRAFEREREGHTMRGLLLSPAARGAVFLGKAVGVAVTLLVCEVVIVALVALLFGAPIERNPLLLALVMLLLTIGYSIVGSVFAGMLLGARSRGVLLAVSLYPILMPALMAAVKGTAAAWAGGAALAEGWFWVKFLLVFDAVFLVVSLWAFESLVVE